MTSALLNLRKQAGFKNAKDFAAAEGIAEATYARYESSPEKIPLKSAWQLADRFGVPIDVIVGRRAVDVASLRGRVQEAYEALSDRSRASLDDYLAFLAQRDERELGAGEHGTEQQENENQKDVQTKRHDSNLKQRHVKTARRNGSGSRLFPENRQKLSTSTLPESSW